MSVGVYVLGMHRSGTSAATRLVNLLGVPLCSEDDLVGEAPSNPRGHWESASLVRFNDELLRLRAAAWWCPPRYLPGWQRDSRFTSRHALARKAFAAVHGTEQWVWKDPRNVLTLPFWLEALPTPPVAVVVIRDPSSVAYSLQARHPAYSLERGVQLWERYGQHLLRSLAGLPAIFTLYDDLLTDPVSWCAGVRSFLTRHGVTARARPTEAELTAFVDPSLRHHHLEDLPAECATSERLLLAEALNACVGEHDSFTTPPLPTESPATDVGLATVRARHGLVEPPQAVFSEFTRARARKPTVRKRPPASVVVVSQNGTRSLRETVEGLRHTCPSNVEIVVVDNRRRRNPPDLGGARLVCSDAAAGVGGARNAGIAASSGELVVFSADRVKPFPGWYEDICEAASWPDVGAVGPTLQQSEAGGAVGGLTFVDASLSLAWLEPHERIPHPVPLLAGCFVAAPRRALERVGGFDESMLGSGTEDLELSLRLWRAGFECRVTPSARVVHSFDDASANDPSGVPFLHNLLRLGTLHLSRDNYYALIESVHTLPAFPAAMAAVLAGDALDRRRTLRESSLADDEWFFRRFGMPVGEAARAEA